MLERTRYLLGCIREDPKDEGDPGRYEAAGELEALFDHVADDPTSGDTLVEMTAAVTEFFLAGDQSVRTAIETGFLEHALEQPRLRPLFAHWANDDRLRRAWQLCSEWGEAHTNFMKGQREQLPPQSI
jgi:hypothetical protein